MVSIAHCGVSTGFNFREWFEVKTVVFSVGFKLLLVVFIEHCRVFIYFNFLFGELNFAFYEFAFNFLRCIKFPCRTVGLPLARFFTC